MVWEGLLKAVREVDPANLQEGKPENKAEASRKGDGKVPTYTRNTGHHTSYERSVWGRWQEHMPAKGG